MRAISPCVATLLTVLVPGGAEGAQTPPAPPRLTAAANLVNLNTVTVDARDHAALLPAHDKSVTMLGL